MLGKKLVYEATARSTVSLCCFPTSAWDMGVGYPQGCCLEGDASDVPQIQTFPFSVVPQLEGCSTAPSLSQHPSCVYCHATFFPGGERRESWHAVGDGGEGG